MQVNFTVVLGFFTAVLACDLARALDAGETLVDAQRYEHGEGVEQSYLHAYRLYCLAALQGNGEAAYRLGWMHLNGRGMPKQDATAAGWFRLADSRGEPHSSRLLNSVLISVEAQPDPNCPLHTSNPDRATIEAWVRALAFHYRIGAEMVLAVIEVESRFNPRARSPSNAQGLMQLIPATAKRFSVDNAWDPFQNLIGGMRYLRWLLDYYDGDIKLALAAYNAGEQAVNRYGGVPPYRETQDYVHRIARLMGVADHSTTRHELNEISFRDIAMD